VDSRALSVALTVLLAGSLAPQSAKPSPLDGTWTLKAITGGPPGARPDGRVRIITGTSWVLSGPLGAIAGHSTFDGRDYTESTDAVMSGPRGGGLPLTVATYRIELTGSEMRMTNRATNAAETWLRVFGPGPTDAPPLVVLACASTPLGRAAEAAIRATLLTTEQGAYVAPRTRIQTAVEQQPDSAAAHLDAARCALSQGRTADASAGVRRAMELLRDRRERNAPVQDNNGPVRLGTTQPVPEKRAGQWPEPLPEAAMSPLLPPVILDVTVDRGGKVKGSRVIRSVPAHDAAVRKAVESWVFAFNAPGASGREAVFPVVVSIGGGNGPPDAIDAARVLADRGDAAAAETILAGIHDELALRMRRAELAGKRVPDGEFGAGAYYPGPGIRQPGLLREVKPDYPHAGMSDKLQGTVVLDAVILPDGTVGDVRVVRSLDVASGMDAAAIGAARQWRFTPATDPSGQPIPLVVSLELAFRLH
jgi:TonB family protein